MGNVAWQILETREATSDNDGPETLDHERVVSWRKILLC